MFHILEPRRLFSQLVLTGTAGADAIDLSDADLNAGASAGLLIENIGGTGVTATIGNTTVTLGNGDTTTQQIAPGSTIDSIRVDLGGGDDSFSSTSIFLVDLPTTLLGGSGNDTLDGGSGPDSIDGGDGDDVLEGHLGNDFISGDAGADSIQGDAGQDTLMGGDDGDEIEGGAGNDLITGNDGSDQLYADTHGLPDASSETDVDTLFGGAGDDLLSSRYSRVAVLRGEDGNDTFDVGAGNLTPISTRVIGGPGIDTEDVVFNAGQSFAMSRDMENLNVDIPEGLRAGTILGNSLANDIFIEPQQTMPVGNADPEPYLSVSYQLIAGGDGNDTINAGAFDGYPTNTQQTALNTDTINQIDGDTGDDTLIASRFGLGNSTFLRGGPGHDTLSTTSPNTAVYTQARNSTVWADYSDMTVPVTVTLDGKANDGPAGDFDTIGPGVTNVRGGEANDVIVGDSNDNIIDGYLSSDFLRGFGGTDFVVYTGRRRGVRQLPAGVTSKRYAVEGDRIFTDVEGTVGTAFADIIYGTASNETLFGQAGADYLNGQAGDDTLVGGDGADTLDGGNGNDTAEYDDNAPAVNVTLDGVANDTDGSGATTEDVLTENVDNVKTVVGDDGPNRLTNVSTFADGGAGDDVIVTIDNASAKGGAGNDKFINQNGEKNVIDGGPGFDSVEDEVGNIDVFKNVELNYDAIGGTNATPQDFVSQSVPSVATVAASSRTAPAVAVYLDSRHILRVQGTAGDDAVKMTQVGHVISVLVNGTLAGTFDNRHVVSIAIDGGAGNDSIILQGRHGVNPVQVAAVIFGGAGNDLLFGGSAGDIIGGEGGDDTVDGGLGNDDLSGDYIVLLGNPVPAAATVPDGNDVIIGGGGTDDLVTYTNRTGPVTIDLRPGHFSGGAGERDQIEGVNYVAGGQGNDVMVGSAANDVLIGGPGNDTVAGGAGNDVMQTGLGSDSVDADGGNDFIDTGAEAVPDRVVARLDQTGFVPTNATGTLLFGEFDAHDYFTLSKRNYGTSG